MTDPQQMLARLRAANEPTPLPLITDAIATIEQLQRTAGDDGYKQAFYEIADMLGIGARPFSPKMVWENELRPMLQNMIAERNAMQARPRGKSVLDDPAAREILAEMEKRTLRDAFTDAEKERQYALTKAIDDAAKPHLVVTRGDGKPLPDQGAAILEFLERYSRCNVCGMRGGAHRQDCRNLVRR